jgi:arylsulfatase A-like enzyme
MQVFAMTEYIDSIMGRLFDYLVSNDMMENTYLFFTGDNGSELFPGERVVPARQIRMPSQMVGFKKDITEGGNRQFLLVAGPGIPSGSTDYTLTSVKDLMATAVALGGGDPASVAGWRSDGLSLANLLVPSAAASVEQEERMLFQLKPDCFWPDLVPELGPDRWVLRPVSHVHKMGADSRGRF